jgi:hypothetical protein
MSAGWEGQDELPVMDRRESKPFGPDFKNCIRSWTTVNYSILWVKFSASGGVLDPTANQPIPPLIDFFKHIKDPGIERRTRA